MKSSFFSQGKIKLEVEETIDWKNIYINVEHFFLTFVYLAIN